MRGSATPLGILHVVPETFIAMHQREYENDETPPGHLDRFQQSSGVFPLPWFWAFGSCLSHWYEVRC